MALYMGKNGLTEEKPESWKKVEEESRPEVEAIRQKYRPFRRDPYDSTKVYDEARTYDNLYKILRAANPPREYQPSLTEAHLIPEIAGGPPDICGIILLAFRYGYVMGHRATIAGKYTEREVIAEDGAEKETGPTSET